MLFRLKCHFCGARSKYSKGTTDFQCRGCEAWNFFDKKGEVLDAPARVAAAPRSHPVQLQPSRTFAQPGANHFTPQDLNQTFCQTCLTNQRICTESLSNYLPDDDHPQYYEYEKKLPKYKADLEKRYPQICKKCAPKVQATISKADRYGLQQNVAKNMRDTSARRGRTNKGQRDDWSKRGIRVLLHSLGLILYASLLVQVAWHAYTLLTATFNPQTARELDDDSLGLDDLAFDPGVTDCAKETLHLRFHKPCLGFIGSMMPKALLTSLLLLWYSPGVALWYHHTIRVEDVFGRGQYFTMQLILLFVRTTAWLNLSNPSVTSDLTRSQLLAAHGFMVAFIPLLQKYSECVIRFDAWRIKGKMMKSPDEVDVFGVFAGPERDTSPPQASSVPPVRLFERNSEPFPIESLAPRTTRSNANRNLPYQPPPSPPNSQSVSDEEDSQMDWQPSVKPQMSGAAIDRTYRPQSLRNTNNYNYGMTAPKGWTPMRNELVGIQSQQATEEQREREAADQERIRQQELQNRSPFRGTLPPDPMQRRLHGFQPRVQKKQTPLTERPDFYDQMGKSFGPQRFGSKTPSKIGNLNRGAASTAGKKSVSFATGLSLNDDDEDFSPIKNRHQSTAPDLSFSSASGSGPGGLNLRESKWRLPENAPSTGLEDIFGGGSFRIADEPANFNIVTASSAVNAWPWTKLLLWGLPLAVLGVGWNVQPMRKAVCLWLVERLEAMGY